MARISRRSLLGGAGLAAAAVAAGCSPSALVPAGNGPDSVKVHTSLGGTSPGADTFAAVVEEYRATHRGSELAVVTNGSDLPIVYETSRLARKEADVVMVNLVGNQLSWTELGATIDVSSQLHDWGLADRVLPDALAEWQTPDGGLRAFPYFASNWPVAYNTALLSEVGEQVPTTVPELIKVAGALRKAGHAPVVVGGSDWTGQKLFCQIIQAYTDRDEATHYFTEGGVGDHPGIRRGIEHFVELRKAGVFVDQAQGLTSDSMTTRFNSGQAGIEMAMTSALASTPATISKDVRVGGWPVPDDAVHDHPTMMRGYSVLGLWISPNGAQKMALVEDFIRYLYSESVADRFVTESGRDLSLHTTASAEDFPLVAATQRLTDDDVTEVLLPDLSVPTPVNEPLIQASALAFGKDSTPAQIERALDAAYGRR